MNPSTAFFAPLALLAMLVAPTAGATDFMCLHHNAPGEWPAFLLKDQGEQGYLVYAGYPVQVNHARRGRPDAWKSEWSGSVLPVQNSSRFTGRPYAWANVFSDTSRIRYEFPMINVELFDGATPSLSARIFKGPFHTNYEFAGDNRFVCRPAQ